MSQIDTSNPFADMDSDLDGTAPARPVTGRIAEALKSTGLIGASQDFSERTLKTTSRQRVEVKCGSCSGTGIWRGSFTSGRCFKCNGTGKILRAANYEQAKAAREARKAKAAAEQAAAAQAAVDAWAAANPVEYKWLHDKAPSFDFAASLLGALRKWGHLTEGQLAAVRRCVEKDAARAAEQAAKAAAPKVVGVDTFPRIEKLVRRENLTLHLGHSKVVMFLSGAVAVVSPVFGGGTYGIIEQGGELRRFRKMTDEVYTTLQDVEARGIDAVKEIGIATGRCCMCGRTLTNEGSIEEGIGPICAGKLENF